MAVEVIGPSHISAARRMSALAGSDGSSAFRAVSAPQTGSVATSLRAQIVWAKQHFILSRGHYRVLRLAGTYGKERLELACERALAAGIASSRYVEPRTAWASTAICGVRPTTTELAAPIDAIPNRRE